MIQLIFTTRFQEDSFVTPASQNIGERPTFLVFIMLLLFYV